MVIAKRLMIAAVYVLVSGFFTIDEGIYEEEMVGRLGIEPRTSRLKAECSTSELTPHSRCPEGRLDAGRDHT